MILLCSNDGCDSMKRRKAKTIAKLFRLPFLLGFDYRFGWSEVPILLVIFANLMVFRDAFWSS